MVKYIEWVQITISFEGITLVIGTQLVCKPADIVGPITLVRLNFFKQC